MICFLFSLVVFFKVCMAISARKRYLEELEMSDSDKEDEIFGEVSYNWKRLKDSIPA